MTVELQCSYSTYLDKTIGEIGIGSYDGLVSVRLDEPLSTIVSNLLSLQVSAIPVVSSDGKVVNSMDRSDILWIARAGIAADLSITVEEFISKRSEVSMKA